MGDFDDRCKFSGARRSLCRRIHEERPQMNNFLRRRRPVRVLLVEDNDMYAQTIELLLGSSDAVDFVGRACDGAEGCKLAAELDPDCILMDISMPVLNGFEATAAIRQRRPDVRIVMLTSSDDPRDRAQAQLVGASSYLTKESPLHELEAAVTEAAPARARQQAAWRRGAARRPCGGAAHVLPT
jgi:DNA-binding NarL/FixJ family response regulator